MVYERKNFRLGSSSRFLFSTLFHIFIIASAAAIHFETSNETDYQALLDIKGLIKGDPFQALSSWNDSIHFCDWRGVACSRLHQRVTVLNMLSLHLVGSLSPSIGNLTFLRELTFQDNNFHGTFPEEVGRLFRLQYLRFANNSCEGELPLNITGCSELSIQRGNLLWLTS